MKTLTRSPKQIGSIIRYHRKKRDLSQSDLGNLSQLRQGTISNIENGARGTQIETLLTLLRALDLEIQIIPKDQSQTSHITIEDLIG